MRWIIPVAAIFLAGCQTEAEKAEAEYRLVAENAIDERSECAAARKVEAAYLAEGNEARYEHWNLIASAACM
jgi:uncharacterized lipoprotein YmbA